MDMDLPTSKEELLYYQEIGRIKAEKDANIAIIIDEIKKQVRGAICTPDKKYIYYLVNGNPLLTISNGENIEEYLMDHLKTFFKNCDVLRMDYSAYVTISWQ